MLQKFSSLLFYLLSNLIFAQVCPAVIISIFRCNFLKMFFNIFNAIFHQIAFIISLNYCNDEM